MNNEPILSKEYGISMDIFKNAFKDFQKKFVYPKNIIMTLAFTFIGISYIFPLIRDPGNSTCIMIIIICAFLIAGIWLNSLMIRKNLMNSIEGIQNDRYIAELYENSISIGTVETSENSAEKDTETEEKKDEDDFFAEPENDAGSGIMKTVINFSDDDVKILDKKDYFMIYIVKKMFYVIPKSFFSTEETEILTESFKKAKFIKERS